MNDLGLTEHNHDGIHKISASPEINEFRWMADGCLVTFSSFALVAQSNFSFQWWGSRTWLIGCLRQETSGIWENQSSHHVVCIYWKELLLTISQLISSYNRKLFILIKLTTMTFSNFFPIPEFWTFVYFCCRYKYPSTSTSLAGIDM